jgi:hypothetical protein
VEGVLVGGCEYCVYSDRNNKKHPVYPKGYEDFSIWVHYCYIRKDYAKEYDNECKDFKNKTEAMIEIMEDLRLIKNKLGEIKELKEKMSIFCHHCGGLL